MFQSPHSLGSPFAKKNSFFLQVFLLLHFDRRKGVVSNVLVPWSGAKTYIVGCRGEVLLWSLELGRAQ